MSATNTPTRDVRTALLAAARSELADHGHATISLRAIARRAGVSHAAPKYFFQDRAGLLTAVATEGFRALTAALQNIDDNGTQPPLAAIGTTYIDFGLNNPALFDLMFRPSELHPTDPDLTQAQAEAIGVLNSVIIRVAPPTEPPPHRLPSLTLISWALAHGLLVLTRDGALSSAAGIDTPGDAAKLAHSLAGIFDAQLANKTTATPKRAQRKRQAS